MWRRRAGRETSTGNGAGDYQDQAISHAPPHQESDPAPPNGTSRPVRRDAVMKPQTRSERRSSKITFFGRAWNLKQHRNLP